MNLMLPCMRCLQEDGVPGGYALAEYQDSGRYEMTCPKGHRTVTLLQEQKFETLFEIGAHAINDGYYREAITSFATSRERFQEFATRVLLAKAQPARGNLFQSMWVHVHSQSERQLGAFVFLWGAHYGQGPDLLSPEEVTTRNNVIHKGRIPTRDEAVRFGQHVLDLARSQITMLRSDSEDEIGKETARHLRAIRGDAVGQRSTMSASTIIGLGVASDQPHHARTLEDALEVLRQQRARLSAVR